MKRIRRKAPTTEQLKRCSAAFRVTEEKQREAAKEIRRMGRKEKKKSKKRSEDERNEERDPRSMGAQKRTRVTTHVSIRQPILYLN